MTKGTSDRGVRTEEPGVDAKVPVVDKAAGDEGIDDGVSGDRREPQTSKHSPAKSRHLDANLRQDPLEDLVEDPPDETATPPGPAFKNGRRK